MRISGWRLALVVGAVLMLGVVGLSTVSASARPTADPAPAASIAPSSPSAAGAASDGKDEGLGAWRYRLARLAKHVVHGNLTVDTPDGLVTFQLDHGTLHAVGASSVTIAEAGGASVTVTTNSDTRVRREGQRAKLTDLQVGDQVFVLSRLPDGGGTPVARFIVVPKRSEG